MQLATFKKITKWCVGMSAGYTVANAIGNNTTVDSRRHKAELIVGTAVIGGIVAEKAEDYTDRTIDEIAAGYRAVKKAFNDR